MLFAADDQGGISVNAGGFTVNGDICTNGELAKAVHWGNFNGREFINENTSDEVISDDETTAGETTEFDFKKDMIFINQKLMNTYFSENTAKYEVSKSFVEMNINVSQPTFVTGKLGFEGNVNLNNPVGAVSDIDFNSETINGNNTVIYSKFGDIDIDGKNVSVNGLIYAPFGTVTVDADNFNLNGIIIAQKVEFNCTSNVNINYNNQVAAFVGTESEKLSWSYEDWQYLADTDGDGLPNLIEKDLGTKPYVVDTDGDLLPDGYEVLNLGTDPLKFDTDDNGISDYDEDFDKDGLTNGQEYELGTQPYNADTDGDNLTDGDEVNTYSTDPLNVDTDNDGLNDDDELYFGTDANDLDTDDNGTKDGDEKRFQTFVFDVENDDCAVTEVKIEMSATQNLQKTASVESIMNKNVLCTDVVGLVGEPFEVKVAKASEFEKATLTYKIDKSKLGDTEFDNLLFLWYNEEEDEFVELETIHDVENSSVSVETTHFSKYMLVDQLEWFNAWKQASLYFEDHYEPLASVICYDCSGSMSSSDPNFNYNIYNEVGAVIYSYPTCYRKLAIDNFIDSMTMTDQTALVSFESNAILVSGLSQDKDALKSLVKPYNGGGTNAKAAVDEAFKELENVPHWYTKHIILLSDGDCNVTDTQVTTAYDSGIKIHTIGLGTYAANSKLKEIAEDTNGNYFLATTAEELDAIYKDLSKENHFDLTKLPDIDKDGLPDEFETSGLICSNGKIYYTNCDSIEEGQDTDGDGLKDGEEILIDRAKSKTVIAYGPNGAYDKYTSIVFTFISDPLQAYCFNSKDNALKHDLEFDGMHFKCKHCKYTSIAPEFQDKEILSELDYNTVYTLNMVIYELLSRAYKANENGNTSSLYAGDYEYNSICILKALGEIDKIRCKDEYDGKYEYRDEKGKCVPLVLELEQYKNIDSHNDCTVIQDIVSKKNYTNLNFWYGDGANIIILCIGLIDTPLGFIMSAINDAAAPSNYYLSDSEKFLVVMKNAVINYCCMQWPIEKNVANINFFKFTSDAEKGIARIEAANSIINFMRINIEDSYSVTKSDYKIEMGDYFIRVNYGFVSPKSESDQNHDGREDRDYYPYTRTISNVAWLRDDKLLYFDSY